MAVNNWVLGGQVRLVEVVCVRDVGTAKTGLEDEGSVWTDEESHTACTAGWTGIAFLVEGNVASYHDCVTAIPRRRLDPVDRVEDGVCTTVASIHGVNAFHICVSSLLEQLHEH